LLVVRFANGDEFDVHGSTIFRTQRCGVFS
jgi:hypothetical protein